MHTTNEQLIAEYRNGNKAALEQLIKQNQGLICRIASRYIRCYKGGDYDDLMQEGAIGLLQAVEKYDQDKGKFAAYAAYWIKNAMLKTMRRQVDTISLDEEIDDTEGLTLGDTISDGSNISEQVIDKLTADNLWFTIQKELNDMQFKIFVLTVYGYPVVQIAAKLGISSDKAKDEKKRTLYKLRYHSPKVRRLAKEWLQSVTPSYYSGSSYAAPVDHSYSDTSIVERAVIARDDVINGLLNHTS